MQQDSLSLFREKERIIAIFLEQFLQSETDENFITARIIFLHRNFIFPFIREDENVIRVAVKSLTRAGEESNASARGCFARPCDQLCSLFPPAPTAPLARVGTVVSGTRRELYLPVWSPIRRASVRDITGVYTGAHYPPRAISISCAGS